MVTPLLNKTFAESQKWNLGCYTGSGRTAPLTLAAAIEQGGAIEEITAEQAMCEQAGLELGASRRSLALAQACA